MMCGEIFHPSWWRSFDFRELDLELQEKTIELGLLKVISDTKLSLCNCVVWRRIVKVL